MNEIMSLPELDADSYFVEIEEEAAGAEIVEAQVPPPAPPLPPPPPPPPPPPAPPAIPYQAKWKPPPRRRPAPRRERLEKCILWHAPNDWNKEGGEYWTFRLPLFRAATKGDWEAAKRILDKDNSWIRRPITEHGDRVLHIAVANKHKYMVEKLMERMEQLEDLEETNNFDDTAFCLAALTGAVDIAEVMLRKNKELAFIRGYKGKFPLHMAAWAGHRDMAWLLVKQMETVGRRIRDQLQIRTVNAAIRSQLFDVAVHLITQNSELAFHRDIMQETPLHALALYGKPLEPKGDPLTIVWNKLIERGKNLIQGKTATVDQSLEKAKLVNHLMEELKKKNGETITKIICYPWNVFLKAAQCGSIELLTALIHAFPDIVTARNEKGQTMFHIAIIHRQEDIFTMIHKVGAIKDLIADEVDTDGNTMLHLAAKMPRHRGAKSGGFALQMQREIMWFKAVEEVVGPAVADVLNKNKETALDVFNKGHKDLREKGQEWMKKTAESCTVLASLIATMVFAAAFQPPGGIDSGSGAPLLVNNHFFMAFSICNSLSLFSSSASILLFLSILTSSYEDEDFLWSLPLKLSLGLTGLLISVATMMVAFTSTMLITFRKDGVTWVRFPIAVLASIPVTLYFSQQYPLLKKVFESTRKSQSLYTRSQHVVSGIDEE